MFHFSMVRCIGILTSILVFSACSRGPELSNHEVRYENGELKERYSAYNPGTGQEVRHGPYLRWHDNGVKAEEGTYKDGKKEGIWRQWNFLKKKLIVDEWQAGLRHGVYRRWRDSADYASPPLMDSGSYHEGKKQGLWKVSWKVGRKLWIGVGNYDSGTKEGNWVEGYGGGRGISCRQQGFYTDGHKDGEWNVDCQGRDIIEPIVKCTLRVYRKGVVESQKVLPARQDSIKAYLRKSLLSAVSEMPEAKKGYFKRQIDHADHRTGRLNAQTDPP